MILEREIKSNLNFFAGDAEFNQYILRASCRTLQGQLRVRRCGASEYLGKPLLEEK